MKPLIKGLALNYPVKVFATGFVVLTLLSIPLFWFRFFCQTSLSVNMPRDAKGIYIRPSGLVPPELEDDPNVVIHSIVSASIHSELPQSLGIFDYFIARFPGERRSNVYFFSSERDCMYFDKKTGQIVRFYTDKQTMPDKTTREKIVQLYIGPEGVSETPGRTLGRFIEPIIDRGSARDFILYDKKLRCFFKINFNQRAVIKGPKIGKNDRRHKPIQIGLLDKTTFELSHLNWSPPQIKVPDEDPNKTGNSQTELKPIIPTGYHCDAGPYLLVLDETGRIDLLEKETLEFVKRTPEFPGVAGRLPAPETYFGSKSIVRPRDLLDYEVMPLFLTKYFFENPEEVRMTFGDLSYIFKRSPARVERKYLGMFAASLSRDGTAMALAVFDEKGKMIEYDHTKLPKQEGLRIPSVRSRYVRSSKAVFFGAPWSPALTIGKYLAENLHPPILSVASYFTASAFEADAAHRALFFLPNSFVAMKGREHLENFAERFMSALGLILPSIILSIWLAWRVSKDAVVVGLSENARAYWIIGTLAFGLTAYITYRLTRPKITLVTCPNCGKMRRPDMPKCHRCKSDWLVPELVPPAWRVVDK
ncbi:MAG: bL32 family ribosomal protein [Phycisphaerae bacterium]